MTMTKDNKLKILHYDKGAVRITRGNKTICISYSEASELIDALSNARTPKHKQLNKSVAVKLFKANATKTANVKKCVRFKKTTLKDIAAIRNNGKML